MPTIDNLITLTRLFGVAFEELLCLNDEKSFDPQNLFWGHNREYIVRKICDGDLKVDLPEVFWQFSSEERMQVLSSIKRKGENIDGALYDRLSTSKQGRIRLLFENRQHQFVKPAGSSQDIKNLIPEQFLIRGICEG